MQEESATSKRPSMLRRLSDVVVRPFERRFGPIRVLREHRRLQRQVPSVRQALETIAARWPQNESTLSDRPIFILSAGWRSGSTLLQRLILSGQEALIWGEPYDHCDFVRRLANSLRAFGPEYPPDHYVHETERLSGAGTLPENWVANLYPHPRYVRWAHQAFFRSMYGEPSAACGYARWGFKEVRLGADYAAYLSWLFPEARFVFLIRNPYAAYRSYRRFRGWYDRWPTEPVLTARQFGIRWRNLAGSFVAEHGVPGALEVRFEDLIRGEHLVSPLSNHVDMSLRSGVLTEKIADAGKGTVKPQPAAASEIRALRRQVEPLASQLGYRP